MMPKITLFLPDFKDLVNNTTFKEGDINHAVFYWEDPEVIWFYKPLGSFMYCTFIEKINLPEGIDPQEKLEEIKQLKLNLGAIEVPFDLYPQREFTGRIF